MYNHEIHIASCQNFYDTWKNLVKTKGGLHHEIHIKRFYNQRQEYRGCKS